MSPPLLQQPVVNSFQCILLSTMPVYITLTLTMGWRSVKALTYKRISRKQKRGSPCSKQNLPGHLRCVHLLHTDPCRTHQCLPPTLITSCFLTFVMLSNRQRWFSSKCISPDYNCIHNCICNSTLPNPSPSNPSPNPSPSNPNPSPDLIGSAATASALQSSSPPRCEPQDALN